MRSKSLVSIVALLLSLTLSVSTPAYAQSDTQDANSKSFIFLIPVLKLALSTAIGSGATSLFSRLFSFFTSPVDRYLDCQNTPASPGSFNQGYSPVGQQVALRPECEKLKEEQAASSIAANMSAAQQAQTLAANPIVGVTVERNSSGDAKQPAMEQLITKQQSGDLRITLRTGDWWSLKFDTTVPGRVRLLNTEAGGSPTQAGYYEVVGYSENRMPRNTNLQMAGNPGQETLDLDFEPCVSKALENDPRVAPFKGKLPTCSDELATKQYVPREMTRVDVAKAINNSEATAFGAIMAASPEPKNSSGVVRVRIKINHVSPSSVVNQPSSVGPGTVQGVL